MERRRAGLRPVALLGLALLAALPAGLAAQEEDEDDNCFCLPDMQHIEQRIRGALSRARMGIALEPERDTDQGVYIADVAPRSGAEAAGLRRGDILLEVDGRPLARRADDDPSEILLDVMRDVEAGDTLSVRYLRDGRTLEAAVATDRMRAFAFSAGPGEFRMRMPPMPRVPAAPMVWHVRPDRLRLVEMNPGLGEYFGTERGVLVAEVDDDSELGLRSGDVILAIGGREIEGPEHAYRILGSYTEDEETEIRVVRNQRELIVSGRNR